MFRPPDLIAQPDAQLIDDAVWKAVAKYNLPRWFYYAQIQIESSFNRLVVNKYDSFKGTPWAGTGLVQLTGKTHHGKPYPWDLQTPNNSNIDWVNAQGINLYGVWILMTEVTRLENATDPWQNLARYSTVHAVKCYWLVKQRYQGISDLEALKATVQFWKSGVVSPTGVREYNPNHSYLIGQYGYNWAFDQVYKPCTDEDGPWNGKPRLLEPPIDWEERARSAELLLKDYQARFGHIKNATDVIRALYPRV